MSQHIWRALTLSLLITCVTCGARGSRLVEVRTIDDEYLMVHWLDGSVEYRDDGRGPTASMGHEVSGGEVVRTYGAGLNIVKATDAASYEVRSRDDRAYAVATHPSRVYRKTKVNGTTNRWPEPEYTVEHTIYLHLPHKLQQGKHYVLRVDPGTQTDRVTRDFVFDVFSSVSEAVHTNLIGYNPDHTVAKSADLYMWLGDGGTRDYSRYVGKKVILYEVMTGKEFALRPVTFWKPGGPDFGGWNLTASPVWNCDFSSFSRPGTYRLAVEGVGCSPTFEIRRDIYYEPFRTSLRGFFYMRIGASKDAKPTPRQPRFIPGKDPAGFRVYRTTYGPWHPDWLRAGGDQWDNTNWSRYKEPGDPTNPNAWGGHSDACDWDRNPAHIPIIWDLLLPYLLSNGKLGDDNLGIPESGNGVPDLIDEARYEVDFWLRLRDGKGGYSAGLNNPTRDHLIMYQAAARPYMAWASAANCAMLADCYRIAGKKDLMRRYRDAAIEAWKVAGEQDLDTRHGIGNGVTRGRDLKMMAAAFLYNVTGDRLYEDAMAHESVVTSPASKIDEPGKYCQNWGTAAYLLCAKRTWHTIHHPELLRNMLASILREARSKNVSSSSKWPSRRSSDNAYGWFQSVQEVQRVCIAHAVATTQSDRNAMLKALILEADYGLGRNPMNMVQMSGLGSRCVVDMYTSGRNDGTPGVHPGHTPYMNADAWGKGYMADPQWYAAKGYPTWDKWPHGEALWPVRYCYSNNEFTPQQTMRGKMCLLAYLYSLGARAHYGHQ